MRLERSARQRIITAKGARGLRRPTVLLAETRALDVAVDATSVYWTDRDGSVKKLTPK